MSAEPISAPRVTARRARVDVASWFATGQGWAWATDRHHRVTALHGRFEGLTGVPLAAAIGQSWSEFWTTASDDPAACTARQSDLAEHRPFRDVTGRLALPGSRPATLRVSGAPRFDRRGRFLGYRGTAFEITGLAQHLRTAEEHERILERSEALSGTGSWRRVVGSDAMTWSPQLYAIFGRDPANFVPSLPAIMEQIADEDRGRVAELVDRAARTRSSFATEYTIVRPSGRLRRIEVTCEIGSDPNGGPDILFGTCRDVTGLRRRERAIADRQRLLDEAGRIAKVGGWSVDLLTGIVEWGEETGRIFALPHDPTASHERFMACFEGAASDSLKAALRRAFEDGVDYDLELPMRNAAGAALWIRSSCRVVLRDGQPIRVLGAVQDITAVKRQEQALRERERQLSEAQAIAAIGSWRWDVASGELTWSDQSFRVFGLALGSPAPSFAAYCGLLHLDDREQHLERVRAALESKGEFVGEHRVVRPDGSVRYTLAKGRCELDAAGEVIGMLGTIQDVTERVQVEQALRDREAELREAQAIAGIGSWRWEVRSGTVTCSEQICRITGHATGMGKPSLRRLHAVCHPDDRKQLRVRVAASLRTGKNLAAEFRIVRPDRAIRHLQVIARCVADPSGAVAALVGTAQDVTEQRRVEAALRERERLLNEAQAIAGVGSWSEDLRSGEVTWSDQYWRIVGLEPGAGEPGYALYHALCHPDDRSALAQRVPVFTAEHPQITTEHRIVRPDGAVRHVQVETRCTLEADGTVVRLDGTIQDVTERREAMAALHAQAVMLREAQRVAGLGTVWRRANEIASHWSNEMYRLLGHEPGTIEPSAVTVQRFVLEADRDRYDALVLNSRQNGTAEDEIRIVRADGEVRSLWIRVHVEPGSGDRPALVHAAHLDVTALKEAEERLQSLAFFDTLTGSPNRASFFRELGDVVRQRSSRRSTSAVLLLDLDRFKEVNDTLGHPAGDRLLVEVAERARAEVRGADMVSRLGGDEFAIILREVRSSADAAQVAERLIAALRAPFTIDGQEVRIGASIGIARWPQDGSDPDTLLRNADLALYAVKDAGRDGYRFFEPRLNRIITERRAIEVDLRVALRDDEMSLHYQPQLEIATERICGVEALLRWRRRGHDVPPARFVPIAESCGMIGELGAWVIGRAVADMAALGAELGRALPVAVNVSVAQLKGGMLTQRITEALTTHGLGAGLLHVELTESIFADQADAAIMAMLAKLDGLGVTLALDDFGTGYSSLGYLADMPFKILKIDRRFVAGIGTPGRSEAIVTAIVGLGRSLGMTVVAEGVETEEQLAFLAARGCHVAQGYLIGRPAPLARLRTLLARERPKHGPLDDCEVEGEWIGRTPALQTQSA